MTVKRNICFGVLAIVGVLFFTAGIATLCTMDRIMQAIQRKINESLPLTEGSESYRNWLHPPVPVLMQFWVFDVKNPDDVVKNGAKPIVQEKGPYTYREVRPRENVTSLQNDTLLSYSQPKSYIFVPEMSVGSENDTFVSVNLPIVTAATMVQYQSWYLQKLLEALLLLAGEHLFETYTVNGYLWGTEETTLKAINDFFQKHFGIKPFKTDKFGLFYGPGTGNGSADGTYEIRTGVDDLDHINDIETWNYNKSLIYWRTKYCNMINGTDGTMWHPDVKTTETLYLFSSDICRSIYIQHNDNVTVEGIDLYHFVPPAAVFASHLDNPDNEGFCTPNCLGSGVLNVSNCKGGAPIIISQPHFFQGEDQYIDAIEGLHPSVQHQTFIDIEPMTGVAMKVAKKLQINIHIKKLASFSDTSKFNMTIFPLIWLNESATITAQSARAFKQEIILPMRVIQSLPYVFTAIGAAFLLILLVWLGYIFVRTRNEKYLELNNEVAGDQ